MHYDESYDMSVGNQNKNNPRGAGRETPEREQGLADMSSPTIHMKKRNLILISAAALAVAGVVGAKTGFIPANWIPWSADGASAQAQRGPVERNVPVDVAVAQKKR